MAHLAVPNPRRHWRQENVGSSTRPVHKRTVDGTQPPFPSTTQREQYQRFTRLSTITSDPDNDLAVKWSGAPACVCRSPQTSLQTTHAPLYGSVAVAVLRHRRRCRCPTRVRPHCPSPRPLIPKRCLSPCQRASGPLVDPKRHRDRCSFPRRPGGCSFPPQPLRLRLRNGGAGRHD
jgi:hypothetical protein